MSGAIDRLPAEGEIGKKNFAGNIFDRMRGLDFILAKCSGCNVLDIGSNEGLISYEFARNGARLIHGFERDGQMVSFAERLFRDVPIESRFIAANLAISGDEFEKQYQAVLLQQYDVVLFLGVYHHLKKQMPIEHLHNLVEVLLDKTKRWFVVRTKAIAEFESIILSRNFKLVHSSPSIKGKGGLLHIYQKKS